jgi:hypothetical protein
MDGNPQPTTIKVGIASAPRLLAKRPFDAQNPVDELLIVSDGRSDQYGQVLEAPALTVLTAAGEEREYALRDPGQRMKVSDDGQFAILFNNPAYVDSTSLLTNPSEAAIVNLGANSDPSQNPTIRNLDTVGGPPFAVWFLQLTVATQLRPFALFGFPFGVSLIDLTKPTEPGHKLDLSSWLPSGGMNEQSGFGVVGDPAAAEVYLKHSSSNELKVLSVVPSAAGDGGVDVSVKSLTVGNSPPGDMAVYSPAPGTTRLLVTLGSSVAAVAPDSDTVTQVPLPFVANDILQFDKATLLFGADQMGVTFVDLANLESSTTQALQGVNFGSAISSYIQLPFLSSRLPIILKQGGIDVLDLVTRHWSPVDSAVPITSMIADSKLNRLWVTSTGDTRIGYLDFGSDATQSTLTLDKETRLDNPVQYFFRMDNGDLSRVVVTHDQVGGAVTLVDAVAPARSSAMKLEGFLLSDLL